MLTRDDVQSFLDRMEVRGGTVEELGEGLWKVRTSEEAEVVVNFAPPVVILRVRVMELPAERAAARRAVPAAAGVQRRASWCTAPTASRAITSC